MTKMHPWEYRPYNPISQFYKERFGEKIHKLSVSVAETCPNREGFKGMQTCVFCDEWGSAAYPEEREKSLSAQLEIHRAKISERYNAKKFLVYYQAYTNTFAKVSHLRALFDEALQFEEVKGLVIGTRPDCISPAVLKLWQEYSEKTFVSVELGVQSFFDDQVEFLRRGHTAQDSILAIEKIARETNVNIGVHLMFGLPGENDAHLIETAKICSQLPIHNVKLHNLHVLKNTPLAEIHARGEFAPVELDEYARRVVLFLEHLAPHVCVHRLAAVSSRWDELVAPDWVRYKMFAFQRIMDMFAQHNTWQSKKWQPRSQLIQDNP